MVEEISRLNGTQQAQGLDGGVRFQGNGSKISTELFRNQNQPQGKGTSIERSGGNPFYAKADFERYDGLGGNRMTIADTETKKVQAELARVYNDVKRLNPEAVENLEFPPLPDVPPKGKKDVRLTAYLTALNEYKETCEELLRDVGEATTIEQINANTDQRARETQGLIVATSSAELATIYGLQEDMFEGLKQIHDLIENETHKIITAVDANGNKVIRAINKATGEIKEHITRDGKLTRVQEFLNTVGINKNINYTRTQLGLKIDNQGAWTRNDIRTAIREDGYQTRQTVRDEAEYTRQTMHDESEQTREEVREHSTNWHGLPDRWGLLEQLFDGE